jgi:hypothetical protein
MVLGEPRRQLSDSPGLPLAGPARGRDAALVERRGDGPQAASAARLYVGDDGRQIGHFRVHKHCSDT